MTKWQATFLGLKHLPRELSGFEIEAFFTFTLAERQLIEERRRPALKLGLGVPSFSVVRRGNRQGIDGESPLR
jgi:hypothetical protein